MTERNKEEQIMRAKTKLTRLCGILLILAMLVGLLPTAALAADATADFVTNPAAAEALLGSGASWNSDTKTLTLNGVNFTTTAATAVKLPDGAIIELNGANTIMSTYSNSGDCYGIYGAGSLTIQGTGTLNVTSGTPNNLSFGIHAEGSVTINSGAVTATGGVAGEQSYGIRALHGDLTIKGGTVTATGGNAKESSGLWAGNNSLVISGGKVVAQGGNVINGTSSGIYANKVVIKNTGSRIPHVTTRGGNGVRSYGIFVYGSGKSVTISGGAVITKAGSATSSAAALSEVSTLPTTYWWRTSDSGDYSNTAYNEDWSEAHLEIWSLDPTATADFTGDADAALARLNTVKTGAADSTWVDHGNGNYTLTLNGVNFVTTAATAVILPANTTIVLADGTTNTIKGGSSSQRCYGIYSADNLTIQGSGTLNVTGGDGTGDYFSYGIFATDLTIKGGTINANGGKAAGYQNSYGIYVDNLTIDGGTLKANGGKAQTSYGIFARGSMVLNDGTVEATGAAEESSRTNSYGIHAYGGFQINGGTLIAKAISGYNKYAVYHDSIKLPSHYWWRDWNSGRTYYESTDYSYYYNRYRTYLEIRTTDPSISTSETADFTAGDGTAALALLNAVKTGTEDSTWDSGTKTLTLNGVYFATNAATAVKLPAGATIVLADGTTNTIKGGDSGSEDCYGIDAYSGNSKALTITGSGRLNVTAGSPSASTNRSAGIYSYGDVTISGGTVEAVAGNAVTTDSYGICSYNGRVNISVTDGGAAHVIAKGGDVTNPGQYSRSCGIFGYNGVTISGGTVEATGGNSSPSYGIFCMVNDITISGGAVKAKADDESGTASALNKQPKLPAAYSWRTSPSGDYSTDIAYEWRQSDAYLELTVVPTYNVTFDANGGTDTMAAVSGVSGNYPLPANGFTAPAGKQFKGWAFSADGAVISGTSITVTGNTTLYAIWENTKALSSIAITTPPTKTTYTVGESFDTAGMVVKATYSDGSTATVTDYTVSPSAALTTSNNSVTISYTEGGVTQTATQTITVNPAAPTGGGIYIPPTYKVESQVTEDTDGSVSFSKNSAKKGDTVAITVTPDRYYKTSGVIVKDASGRMIAVTDNGNGTFTFQMPDSKVTVEPVFSWDNPFVDVAGDAYYAPAVEWALKNEVTDGTSDTTFSPDAGCTRGQIVTFLWRAAGCPEPAGRSSFTDVSADVYYAKAVAWAAEQGITGGTGDGKFSPDAVCTRGQIVTFLWRAEKSPAVGTANPFTDVEADAYYAGATNWAVENGITEGTGDGTTFSPANDCTRAQIVTFLYRYFVK